MKTIRTYQRNFEEINKLYPDAEFAFEGRFVYFLFTKYELEELPKSITILDIEDGDPHGLLSV